jgi:hypothetical protein
MSDILLEISTKSLEEGFMSTLTEAQTLIRECAQPCPAGDKVKAAILRVHTHLQTWSYNRVRDVWYGGDRVRISGEELDYLRAKAAAKKNSASSGGNYNELIKCIAELDAALRVACPELRRPKTDAILEQAHRDGILADNIGDDSSTVASRR